MVSLDSLLQQTTSSQILIFRFQSALKANCLQTVFTGLEKGTFRTRADLRRDLSERKKKRGIRDIIKVKTLDISSDYEQGQTPQICLMRTVSVSPQIPACGKKHKFWQRSWCLHGCTLRKFGTDLTYLVRFGGACKGPVSPVLEWPRLSYTVASPLTRPGRLKPTI